MTAGEPVNSQELTKVAGAITRCLASLRGKSGKQRGAPPLPMRDRILRDRQAV
jgi:hypothetical protein